MAAIISELDTNKMVKASLVVKVKPPTKTFWLRAWMAARIIRMAGIFCPMSIEVGRADGR